MEDSILSVGIDIGTSTTQVIFSRLQVENTSGYFTVPRAEIVSKKVVYASEVHPTPLLSSILLDGEKVRDLVANEFAKAGFSPQETTVGAVIITGESARKENAKLVLEKLSEFAGDFVVSTAGPDLEAVIAGKGCGAQQFSEEYGTTVVNLDIGGGTTNIALFRDGQVVAKGCLDIGGRLVRLDSDGRILAVSPAAATVADSIGITICVGEKLSTTELSRIADKMAQLLEQQLGLCPPESLLHEMKTPGSSDFCNRIPIKYISFSGGVANFIYRSEQNLYRYGDFGVFLGNAVRSSRLLSNFRHYEPKETIRATVIGAGSYTSTLSGSTIHFSADIFPLKNVPVLRLSHEEELQCMHGNSQFLKEKIAWFLNQSDEQRLVLGLSGRKNITYKEVQNLARTIAEASAALTEKAPLMVVIEQDMAKVLGQCISNLTGTTRPIVCVDNIEVEQGDYMDFGHPLLGDTTIPVVVKTLIFA